MHQNVRIDEKVFVEIELRFTYDHDVMWRHFDPLVHEHVAEILMSETLWRHRNDLPANQFKSIVLAENPRPNGPLDLSRGPTPSRQSFCGLRAPSRAGREKNLVHPPIISFYATSW